MKVDAVKILIDGEETDLKPEDLHYIKSDNTEPVYEKDGVKYRLETILFNGQTAFWDLIPETTEISKKMLEFLESNFDKDGWNAPDIDPMTGERI